MPVQGNLDPLALLAGGAALDRGVDAIMAALAGGPFIFNLGHGILPETPIAHVEQMLEAGAGLGSDVSTGCKAFHIIAVIAWMAGMLYLPRLFVYHCEADAGLAAVRDLQGDGAPAAAADHQRRR